MPDDGTVVKLTTRGKPDEVSGQSAEIPDWCSGRPGRETMACNALYNAAENLAAWSLQD
jgi:hypothetical protein